MSAVPLLLACAASHWTAVRPRMERRIKRDRVRQCLDRQSAVIAQICIAPIGLIDRCESRTRHGQAATKGSSSLRLACAKW